MFIEVHAIQNFAPSNLNRDDTNNPKDCEFGGVRRARISSQCIKRAIRMAPIFAETTGIEPAKRTKYLIDLLRTRLVAAGKAEGEVLEVLTTFVPAFASKLDGSSNENKTAVLVYLSEPEIEDVVHVLLENWTDLGDEKAMGSLVRALVRAHQGQTSAPDIAMFGRMLAEKPALNIDAACQVAHAISTHRVTMEMDFFTAVDDLNPDDTAGAGMLGFVGFDSPCYYRYARIDWRKLVENLNGEVELARRSVEGFLRALIEAVPTGKQTSFAAYNPPDLLLAVVREDGMGWSLANAFERPVRPEREGGLVGPSAAALDAYWGNLCRAYGTGTLACTAVLALDPELPLTNLEEVRVQDVEAWTGAVLGALPG
jgi:CRISPR system Cascade subunit CasC